jgi:serine/threonine-protein kinase RsbW
MEVAFRVNLPRESATVPVVRRLCRSSLRSLGVEESCVSDLELALTEACTNVLRHASGTDDYEVEVRTDGRSCDLRVRDAGAGFDPDAEIGEVDGAESGRGIQLMRLLVDRLQFASDQSTGTVVHLAKKLELRSDSPLAEVVPDARGGGSPPHV